MAADRIIVTNGREAAIVPESALAVLSGLPQISGGVLEDTAWYNVLWSYAIIRPLRADDPTPELDALARAAGLPYLTTCHLGWQEKGEWSILRVPPSWHPEGVLWWLHHKACWRARLKELSKDSDARAKVRALCREWAREAIANGLRAPDAIPFAKGTAWAAVPRGAVAFNSSASGGGYIYFLGSTGRPLAAYEAISDGPTTWARRVPTPTQTPPGKITPVWARSITDRLFGVSARI